MAVVPKLLLIDADGILYRAGFATEKTEYLITCKDDRGLTVVWDDCVKSAADVNEKLTDEAVKEFGPLRVWSRKEVEPEDKAIVLADIILRDIKDRYPGYVPELWLSPPVGNFRKVIATRAKYKGNRDGASRPKHFKAIRQHLIDRHAAIETAGQEADDILGIQMSAFPDSVCVSFDKDLLQIPGLHYDWVKKEETKITPKQGAINFWTQVLTGDPVDNVPGIEGIGPKKAAKLLEGVKNSKEAQIVVQQAYADAYGNLGFDYFQETAGLVWIRRKPGKAWNEKETA